VEWQHRLKGPEEINLGYIVSIEGPEGEARDITLIEGDTPIGRDPANILMLEGRGVSRRHAKFVLSGDRLVVADLGSTYGTRVNGVTTLRRELALGDEVTIGMHVLRVAAVPDTKQTAAPPDSKSDTWPLGYSAYSSDEVTQSPEELELYNMRTQEMSRSSIQFVLDNLDESGRSIKIVPNHDSDLISAVKRMGTTVSSSLPSINSSSVEATDYHALLLMYKVSELLAAATDLDGFVTAIVDLVLEEVRADTVVLLMQEEDGQLAPRVIRYRGSLNPGEIPVSQGIVDRVIKERSAIMSNDVGHDSRIKAGQSVMIYKIQAVLALPLLIQDQLHGVLYVGRSVGNGFTSEDSDLMSALVSLIVSGIERAMLREHVAEEKHQRKSLERFHPPEIVDRLFSRKTGEITLEEHKATVMVCDLLGFSNLVQRIPPRQLATVLHEYYELLYEKVFANGGSLVKLHDGWALALFGTPQSHDRDAAWALESALELCEEFTSLSLLWPESQHFALRCALDTGMVVAGVVGSTERMEYAALGLPITTASVLVQQIQGTEVWVTERAWLELPKSRHRVQELPPLADVRVFRLQQH
jgi:adenylate cyclase